MSGNKGLVYHETPHGTVVSAADYSVNGEYNPALFGKADGQVYNAQPTLVNANVVVQSNPPVVQGTALQRDFGNGMDMRIPPPAPGRWRDNICDWVCVFKINIILLLSLFILFSIFNVLKRMF